jgi:murein DD-endopeptidase MepM/ murein hydrolase activator NlpD
MRRLALAAVALCLAVLGGTARADTYAVVPAPSSPPIFSIAAAPFDLPSLAPNTAGTLLPSLLTPPASPVQLSYPQLLGLWQRAGAAYGIPWQVLAAINKVESNFGRNMGPSSAGAIGWMQFMPSTWARWGVDADGNGVADPWNPTDAIFGAARYLAAAGGATDLSRAVFAYNHADWYVQEVLGLADLFGNGGTVAFSLDRMQQELDAARRALATAGDRVLAAEKAVQAESRRVARWTARADRARLLSDRLAFQQRAGLAAQRRDTAAVLVTDLQQTLAAARQRLVSAEAASSGSSFVPAASELLGGPSYSNEYVFPVGGGPGVVHPGHSHHDYPAVDIAAPLGSPLYALADSVVLRSWSEPDPRCGIGLTLRAFDGQVWTYCHLAVLDPKVVPGASLSAGDQVGLVGATGDASGPHLHLQLQPPTEWPQGQAWFLSFAGRAYTWSDGPTKPVVDAVRTPALVTSSARHAGPVFRVEPAPPVVYFSRP